MSGVWLVLLDQGDDSDVLGAFSSRDAAQSAASRIEGARTDVWPWSLRGGDLRVMGPIEIDAECARFGHGDGEYLE